MNHDKKPESVSDCDLGDCDLGDCDRDRESFGVPIRLTGVTGVMGAMEFVRQISSHDGPMDAVSCDLCAAGGVEFCEHVRGENGNDET